MQHVEYLLSMRGRVGEAVKSEAIIKEQSCFDVQMKQMSFSPAHSLFHTRALKGEVMLHQATSC